MTEAAAQESTRHACCPPGSVLTVTTGGRDVLRLRAGEQELVAGALCVWAAAESEWQAAEAEQREPELVLWPCSAVNLAH